MQSWVSLHIGIVAYVLIDGPFEHSAAALTYSSCAEQCPRPHDNQFGALETTPLQLARRPSLQNPVGVLDEAALAKPDPVGEA